MICVMSCMLSKSVLAMQKPEQAILGWKLSSNLTQFRVRFGPYGNLANPLFLGIVIAVLYLGYLYRRPKIASEHIVAVQEYRQAAKTSQSAVTRYLSITCRLVSRHSGSAPDLRNPFGLSAYLSSTH